MGNVVEMPEQASAEVDRLARKVLDLMQNSDGSTRVVIGISGVPGSGKSTVARAVSLRANAIYTEQHPEMPDTSVVVDIPMDGFHYTRAHLSQMPDPAEAVKRRGAAYTFDAEGFHRLIQRLTQSPIVALRAPSFDHAVKDPIDDDISIPVEARAVLVEGNYCALNRVPWSDAAQLMTEVWYVDVPAEVAQKRVAARHVVSGVCADEKSALERALGSDELNAEDIRHNLLHCHEILKLS